MTTKTLTIRQVTRYPYLGPEDQLLLNPGVNVLAGPPNTGKTKWLNMIDYLMGDTGKPEDAFGQELATKYDSLVAEITIGVDDWVVSRRWKEPGGQSKVYVNNERVNADDFTDRLLERLAIPLLHFPKGSPYSENTWPRLSWRMLLRHIYRQQRLWSDFADKQPEGEQLACILHFVGLAENVYPDELGELVSKNKKVRQLEAQKENFVTTLNDIAAELLHGDEMDVALTEQSIDTVMEKRQTEIGELQQKRQGIIVELVARSQQENVGSERFQRLSTQLADLQTAKELQLDRLSRTQARLEEMNEYRASLSAEIGRLERAQAAGRILGSLKVTHCPVCDQPVKPLHEEPGQCFLCGQSWEAGSEESAADQRIQYELKQLNSDLQEAESLIRKLSLEIEAAGSAQSQIGEEIQGIQDLLLPFRQVAASILPPDLALVDIATGSLQEQVRQLQRIRASLAIRDQLSEEIDTLRGEISILQARVSEHAANLTFQHASDLLTDGMNTYLNTLAADGKRVWSQGAVRFHLKERGFDVTVGGKQWSSQLGGTLTLFFLLAYHHALLSLTHRDICNYPGLVILDLPATLDETDGTRVSDHENYILQPFLTLTGRSDMQDTQVIVAGSEFEKLEGAHRIELDKVWV
jgi:hypothetical protein